MTFIKRFKNWWKKPVRMEKVAARLEKEVKELKEGSIEYEALDRKVLHALQSRLRHINDLEIWLSHNYNPDHWNPILDAEQAKIDTIRAWAKTLPDRVVRKSYLAWLDYYFELGLRDARMELQDQKIRKDHEEYRARQDSISLATLNRTVPEPPQ